jgi:hypothetical protein
MSEVQSTQRRTDLIVFWTAVAVTCKLTMTTFQGIVARANVYAKTNGKVSPAALPGSSMYASDPAAYLRLDGDFFFEVALPLALGGVFFVANFTLVFVALAALALALALLTFFVGETAVTLSGVNDAHINESISKWTGKAGEKLDLKTVTGFLYARFGMSSGPVLTLVRSVFQSYQDQFLLLTRVAIANTVLFVCIGAVLVTVSRFANAKFLKTKKKNKLRYIRYTSDGRVYISRYTLFCVCSTLPVLSVVLALAVDRTS